MTAKLPTQSEQIQADLEKTSSELGTACVLLQRAADILHRMSRHYMQGRLLRRKSDRVQDYNGDLEADCDAKVSLAIYEFLEKK